MSLFEPAAAEPVGYPRWFSSRGSVIERGGVHEVFVGGTLVGTYDEERILERNILLVQLAEDPECHLERLAKAFEVSSEWVRRLRRRYEKGGVEALRPRELGGPSALSDRDHARLARLFEQGLTATQAHAKTRRGSLSTVSRAHRAWRVRRESASAPSKPALSAVERTLGLPGVEMLPTTTSASGAVIEDGSGDTVRGGAFVQHLGTWLLIAMLARLGLHRVAYRAAGDRVPEDAVRLALDAVVATFAVGEPTLEGVRRLRTPTAPLLVQSAAIPSPDALRATMDEVAADVGAIYMHFAMLRTYLASDRLAARERAIFYIDNHLRPYTGKRVIRKGWRMQDRRVRPGTTDYYLHDEDGRPLFRVDVPSHDSLSIWMLNITAHLRAIVGEDDPILMAFDRGGAFPETMAQLRDEGCEFVTYERAPYPKLPESAFTEELVFADETVRWTESQTNLRKGRGRVRRIGVRDEQGRQINLLASSTLPADRLIEIMRGRWLQENGFKYGKERWGINHLDARKTTAVDPDAIIPNPARRRLDIARRAANVREGDGRNLLVRYPEGHRLHDKALRAIADALEDEKAIDALRPTLPKHARLADTELSGKLRRHDGSRKLVLDTIRIACANAESDLAQILAGYMNKPREAKHLLANIFRAPGNVRVGASTISVDLAPAATPSERIAIANLLRDVSGLRLTLPGDPRRRPLRFRSQLP
jgi:transposase